MPGKKKGKCKKGKSKKSSSKSLKESTSPSDPIAPSYVPTPPKPGERVKYVNLFYFILFSRTSRLHDKSSFE
jgi:hypothetical protein